MTKIKIFIGYAREDFAEAKRMYDYLKTLEGVEPWLDKMDLLPGADWEEEIHIEISQSRFVMLMLSTNSVNKEGYVQKEAQVVLDRLKYFPPGEIFVIPVRLNHCWPRYRVLRKLNWVDLFVDWEIGCEQIQRLLSLERKKLIEMGQDASSVRSKNTLPVQATQIQKILPQDLLQDLKGYAEWLWEREYLPAKRFSKQIKQVTGFWTKQTKGKWLSKMMQLGALEMVEGEMVWTDLGIAILELLLEGVDS